ncbi:galactose mutarotase [Ptiloglossa arizonensis]|uniref:galactose mutarotase n=1 Tax=Ptiloglossa arizonensis TaxID=3350558 RepID=UPI003FA0D7B6
MEVDNKRYSLTINDRDDSSHFNGGLYAFDNVNWQSHVLDKHVVMSHLSRANSEGYPGDMLTQVKYSWTDDNQLRINIRATATQPTPVNITANCLMNLAGHGTGANELKRHVVSINADSWTFADIKDNLPTGAIHPVDRTVYDLRLPTQLTKRRFYNVPGGGYNQNLCITSPSCWLYRFHASYDKLRVSPTFFKTKYILLIELNSIKVIHYRIEKENIYIVQPTRICPLPSYKNLYGLYTLWNYFHSICTYIDIICITFYRRILHPASGRTLEIYSNQPGLQFSTGTDLPDPDRVYPPDFEDFCNCCSQDCVKIWGKDGVRYQRHGGFVLSPQNYPDAVNISDFPCSILYPGDVYAHDITYKFGLRSEI